MIPLKSKPFDVLVALVGAAPHTVRKQNLMTAVWGHQWLSDNSLHQAVREIRKSLRSVDPSSDRLIQTVSTVGYKLVAIVQKLPDEDPIASSSEPLLRTAWHHWSRRTREGFEQALMYFNRAIVETPYSYEALRGKSVTYLMLAIYGIAGPTLAGRNFLRAWERAIGLGDRTAELVADRGHALHLLERRRSEAEALLLEALRLNPSCAGAGDFCPVLREGSGWGDRVGKKVRKTTSTLLPGPVAVRPEPRVGRRDQARFAATPPCLQVLT